MKKILTFLFLTIIVFISYNKGKNIGIEKEKMEYKVVDEIVEDSFRMGCETAIMRTCEVNNVDSCRKFCFEFMQKNERMINILKKKAEVILEQYEKTK